jgi:hypothetical protein
VRTSKVPRRRDEMAERGPQFSHAVFWECNASSHRFHALIIASLFGNGFSSFFGTSVSLGAIG